MRTPSPTVESNPLAAAAMAALSNRCEEPSHALPIVVNTQPRTDDRGIWDGPVYAGVGPSVRPELSDSDVNLIISDLDSFIIALSGEEFERRFGFVEHSRVSPFNEQRILQAVDRYHARIAQHLAGRSEYEQACASIDRIQREISEFCIARARIAMDRQFDNIRMEATDPFTGSVHEVVDEEKEPELNVVVDDDEDEPFDEPPDWDSLAESPPHDSRIDYPLSEYLERAPREPYDWSQHPEPGHVLDRLPEFSMPRLLPVQEYTIDQLVEDIDRIA